MTDESSTTYQVEGMTCAHCVAAVTEEVSAVPGADEVRVTLEDGTLRVVGDASHDAVRAAVDEAGYRLVGA